MASLLRRLATGNVASLSSRLGALDLAAARPLSTSAVHRGLEEFFPAGVYEGENVVDLEPVSGRKYRLEELRARSNVDLHKLWYVCVKERNMLFTMENECRRIYMPMPGPTRRHKVEKTMDRINSVITERELSIQELEKRKWEFDEHPAQETQPEALASEAQPDAAAERNVPATADETAQSVEPAVLLGDNDSAALQGPAPRARGPGPNGIWLQNVLDSGKKKLSEEDKLLLKIAKLNGRNKYLVGRKERKMRKWSGMEPKQLSQGALPEDGYTYERNIYKQYKKIEQVPLPYEDWMQPVLSANKRRELEVAASSK